MFQNWMAMQDFMIQHQKELLREAEADRAGTALRKRLGRSSKDARAMRSCRECPENAGAVQPGSA